MLVSISKHWTGVVGEEVRMRACVDVDYRDPSAVAACVLFRTWTDAEPAAELIERIDSVAPYESGHFYKRELPCLLAVLEKVTEPLEAVIVDGYVWLRDESQPGLGAHLHAALGGTVAVIGVAKTRFASARLAVEVRRGPGNSPLHVTAIGLNVAEAAEQVRKMSGEYRLPRLIKRVDQLCRTA
jgi:deoxyribonuclease V